MILGAGKLEGRPCCIKSNSVVVQSVSIVLQMPHLARANSLCALTLTSAICLSGTKVKNSV